MSGDKLLRFASWALIGLGLLQSVGWVLQIPLLRSLGQVTVASPLPLVFSHFNGLETFSSSFEVQAQLAGGREVTVEMTPKTYGLLGGPYNRRNVYGAVAAYGPMLREPKQQALVNNVLRYGLCEGPLARAMGIDDRILKSAIRVRNALSHPPLDATLEVSCASVN